MKKVKIRVITVKFGRRTIALLWFATQLTRAIIQEVQFCSKIKISKKKVNDCELYSLEVLEI